jgi:hypothetical protein
MTKEQAERDDHKLNDGVGELSPLNGDTRRRIRLLQKHQLLILEIDATGGVANRRHHDVIDQRLDDGAEGGADDHADGHVHDIAFEGKLSELLDHSHRTSTP